LLVDYVLTIAISVSAGADALFSLLPPELQPYKVFVALSGVVILIMMNMRGIKESVISLMPIFILFVLTHVFLIGYTILSHFSDISAVYHESSQNFQQARQSLGLFGVFALIMRSYSMGAGTYTGLEAVSNSVPILKEPRVKTGLTTMRYMAISLAVTVFGLFLAYGFFKVEPSSTKTLNAVLLDSFTAGWGQGWKTSFVWITLFSEAALLFIAAQTGFLDGPRVIGSMAQDNWFPRRFTVLSDRLVTQNGILFMGIAAIIILLLTKGAVAVLVVLYSINVFITFALSQAGMVRHWWQERSSERKWLRKLLINGAGFILTVFILFSLAAIKFREGGWVTILITSSLVLLVSYVKRHYNFAGKMIARLNKKNLQHTDEIFAQIEKDGTRDIHPAYDKNSKTAAICVAGFNGLGIQTFFKVKDEFKEYKNLVFIEVGLVDSGNFKGADELENLQNQVKDDLAKYTLLAEHYGFYVESHFSIGNDIADEIKEISKTIMLKHHGAVFFVGQFILPKATAIERMLHNQTQFAIHNRLSHKGFILVMIPIRTHVNL
jgi:amino acid transporter